MPEWKSFRSVMRKSVLCLLGMLVALGVFAPQAGFAQGPVLYTVDAVDNLLRTVDPVTGDTLSSVAITIFGDVVNKATGLAVHPQTGQFFALLSLQSAGGIPMVPAPRELAILNPTTGAATAVGSTGDAFADIAFASDGTLYAVTGDGALDPEALYTLSTTDGSATFIDSLGNGNRGEAIAFNPNDGLIYHMSGRGVQNVDEILESFDPTITPITPTPINYSVDDLDEFARSDALGGRYFPGCGPIFWRNLDAQDGRAFAIYEHYRPLPFGPGGCWLTARLPAAGHVVWVGASGSERTEPALSD